MCSFACQLDQPDYQCEAFGLSDSNECNFGEVDDCTLVLNDDASSEVSVGATQKVWYDKTKYGRKKGKEGERRKCHAEYVCL